MMLKEVVENIPEVVQHAVKNVGRLMHTSGV